ncbi:sn-glycerol-3-phosphate ABC transporter ATP-binding protein UgpC [Citreicella sp. C3M06]|uniref:ABC transporter ATP-binding protein n=1 Tax=Citreicella sp. C3M06 TaxID=2841564 RepID=UPI001C08EC8B|nr:sn-glycerol-3-phosphate ABC transporter ATP-binding protein UgpC [Citreicella sp. C3M06]MBU2961042.1 sn-glycerol-3-phosphate ABC transporter ATP-binding protein UgpC [Citreicella sp. C3M06]
MTQAFLNIDKVTKAYGAVQVLNETNIAVQKGEFLVLVGPSGCGKSTLLNMIAGLENITSGEVSIDGRVVNDVPPADRNIAMVFQSYALYPNMTVRGNISFSMEMHKVPKPEREAKIAQVAELLQITHLLDRKPGQLSGGQRQRVAMGRALTRDPAVFLFDEPLSNLDAKLRVDMRTEIKKLHQKLGTTIVYVTHDQVEALTLSTRIAVMFGGDVQQLGTPEEVYNNPANMFVAGFMGSPAMNLFPAELIELNGAVGVKVVTAGGFITLPFPHGAHLTDQIGREIVLGVRPESMTDPESADHDSHCLEHVDLPVELVETTGADSFVTILLGGKECIGRFRGKSTATAGQLTHVTFDMTRAVAFDPKTEQRLA